jgi:hypothetical protein
MARKKEKQKQVLAAVRQWRAQLYHRMQNRRKAVKSSSYQEMIQIDTV